MKKMLNTLYITTEDAYLTLKGETVEIKFSDETCQRIPLHTLENIVVFSYKGASPALMGKCEACGIPISFFSPQGRYLASMGGAIKGNVLLRRRQYQFSEDDATALSISRNFIIGKLYNAKQVLLRAVRDHSYQVNTNAIVDSSNHISEFINQISTTENIESLRGIEGSAAVEYFKVFNELVLQQKTDFLFSGRSRRPPLDRINAMMSFAYSLLANECSGALLSVGLDPYVGFMHTDKPGRKSLALDLMEELRCSYADRFVLMMINNRIMSANDFVIQETRAVSFTDEGKKKFLQKWQERKRTEIVHPFLKEKIQWGLVPYSQAMLLARFLRGDLDQYPPFFWR